MKPTASLTLAGAWSGILFSENQRSKIRVYLVVDLEDLVILPEPGPLTLTSGRKLGDKPAHLEDHDRVRSGGGGHGH